MKKLLITSCFLLAGFIAFSQTDTLFRKRSFRIQGQVGINATTFIKNFLVLNSNIIQQVSPYAVNAKALVGFRFAPSFLIGPRFGMGYVENVSSSNNEAQDNERGDKARSRNYRGGLEVQQIISKRFTLIYGADYLYGTNLISTVTTSLRASPNPPFTPIPTRTENLNSSKTTGIGGVIGIQFTVNRHLVLSTEAAFIKEETRGSSETISDNPNNTIRPNFTHNKNTQISLPFFINCNFVF